MATLIANFLANDKKKGHNALPTLLIWIYVIPGQLSKRVQKRDLTYKMFILDQYKASLNLRMYSLLKKSQEELRIV